MTQQLHHLACGAVPQNLSAFTSLGAIWHILPHCHQHPPAIQYPVWPCMLACLSSPALDNTPQPLQRQNCNSRLLLHIEQLCEAVLTISSTAAGLAATSADQPQCRMGPLAPVVCTTFLFLVTPLLLHCMQHKGGQTNPQLAAWLHFHIPCQWLLGAVTIRLGML
jgi:hypothetical protein